MADQVNNVCPDVKNLSITPFGIDLTLFKPNPPMPASGEITIGTVKNLSEPYGIDILIRAFGQAHSQLRATSPEVADRLKLLIVGGGPDRKKLESLVESLELSKITTFAGPVSHQEVCSFLNQLDIYVAPSRWESFGVAVLEASACGVPVVVSDVGGLPEVVAHAETGFVLKDTDTQAFSDTLVQLVTDPILRKKLGERGVKRVLELYEWNKCVSTMEEVYRNVMVNFRPNDLSVSHN